MDRTRGERRDRQIVVVLPDGSPMLIPVAWTDLGGEAPPATPATSPTRLSVSGLRRLVRLVDAMSDDCLHDKKP